jgi:hypothetical protein
MYRHWLELVGIREFDVVVLTPVDAQQLKFSWQALGKQQKSVVWSVYVIC